MPVPVPLLWLSILYSVFRDREIYRQHDGGEVVADASAFAGVVCLPTLRLLPQQPIPVHSSATIIVKDWGSTSSNQIRRYLQPEP